MQLLALTQQNVKSRFLTEIISPEKKAAFGRFFCDQRLAL